MIKSDKAELSSVYAENRIMWLKNFIISLKPILLLYGTDVTASKLLSGRPNNQILYVLDKTKTLSLKGASLNTTDKVRYLGHCTPIFQTLQGLESKLTDLYRHIFSEIRIFGPFSPQKDHKTYLKAVLYDECSQAGIQEALCANYEFLINFEAPTVGRKRRDSLISVFGGGTKDSTGDKVRQLANHNLDDILELYHGHQSTNANLKELITFVNDNTKISQMKTADIADIVSLLVRQNLFQEHESNIKAQRASLQTVMQAIIADLHDFTLSFDTTIGNLLKHIVSAAPTCSVQAAFQNQFVCTNQGFIEKVDLLHIHTAGHLKHYEFLSAFRLLCADREDGRYYKFNEQIHHADEADRDNIITADGIKVNKKCLTNGFSRADHCHDYFLSAPPNVNFSPLYGSVIFTVKDKIFFQSNLGAQIIVNNEKFDIVQPKVVEKSDLPISLIFEKNTYTLTVEDFNSRSYEDIHADKLVEDELHFVLDAFHGDRIITPEDPYERSVAQFQEVLTDAAKLWHSSKVFRQTTISVSAIIAIILLVGAIILIIFCCRKSNCWRGSFAPPRLPRKPVVKVPQYDSESDHYDDDTEKQTFRPKNNRRLARK